MPICPLLTNKVIVAKMNAKTDSSSKVTVAIPQEVNDDAMIDDRFRYSGEAAYPRSLRDEIWNRISRFYSNEKKR
jgi:hypothetical protein